MIIKHNPVNQALARASAKLQLAINLYNDKASLKEAMDQYRLASKNTEMSSANSIALALGVALMIQADVKLKSMNKNCLTLIIGGKSEE